MDYEKKYKEAQKWIESIYSELSHEQQMEAEAFFPELKESEDEDERMKKSIIQTLKKYSKCVEDGNDSPSAKDFLVKDIENQIAWLEKQGDKDKLIQELGKYKVKYTQEVLEKHINSMSNKDDERLRKTTIAFLKDFAEQGYENAVECIDWLEKQGEQKPAWSEEDKDMLENILGTYKTLEDMLDLSTEQDQDILTSMNFERVWLKSLKQKIGG